MVYSVCIITSRLPCFLFHDFFFFFVCTHKIISTPLMCIPNYPSSLPPQNECPFFDDPIVEKPLDGFVLLLSWLTFSRTPISGVYLFVCVVLSIATTGVCGSSRSFYFMSLYRLLLLFTMVQVAHSPPHFLFAALEENVFFVTAFSFVDFFFLIFFFLGMH